MTLFTPAERAVARAISDLAYANPFLPERLEREREVLGERFVAAEAFWSAGSGAAEPHPNAPLAGERASALAEAARRRLSAGARPHDGEAALYEDVVHFALYQRLEEPLWRLVVAAESGERRATTTRIAVWPDFAREAERLLSPPGLELPSRREIPHLFAIAFQLRRAFHFIYWTIVGRSAVAARLRADVWESIFTHDLRRYRRALFSRLGDVATLVTGATGTGKELVARAIALSRWVPFEERGERFAGDFVRGFLPLNLSALSPSLVESELFGHRRGAFTGALADREGWFEVCPSHGAVFLDEIGEIDAGLQVKLLRLLQTRTFQRLGETADRRFEGKLIAATNRDLAAEIAAGRFRADFFYRLCADRIETPPLAAQLADAPDDLEHLVLFLAERIAGGEEAPRLADEVVDWVRREMPPDYAWPGNVRELEQCVRSVLLRRRYVPAIAGGDAAARLATDLRAGALSAEVLLDRYCALVHAGTGSYQETARRLGLDRRTVKRRVERARATSPSSPARGAIAARGDG